MLKHIRTLSAIILLLPLLNSCFVEDDIVPRHEQGGIETGKAVLGETYANQVFYDLASNSTVASNKISDWDLAFSCNNNNWHITLNAAQMMYAGNSRSTDFAQVKSTANIDMRFDSSDGNMATTAIGEWYYFENDSVKSYHYVYVIDRGLDENLQSLGTKKISIDVANNHYLLKYADLNGENEKQLKITKNEAFNYVYFSFDDDAMVNIAPPKNSWSLKFSKYSTMLQSEGEDYPYLVTGALLNPENMSVAMDTIDFMNITIQDTAKYEFSHKMDFIGHEWKYYSFDSEMYTIVPNRHYIVKNYDGYFYKLRFISFYDENGVKGNPVFEMVRL